MWRELAQYSWTHNQRCCAVVVGSSTQPLPVWLFFWRWGENGEQSILFSLYLKRVLQPSSFLLLRSIFFFFHPFDFIRLSRIRSSRMFRWLFHETRFRTSFGAVARIFQTVPINLLPLSALQYPPFLSFSEFPHYTRVPPCETTWRPQTIRYISSVWIALVSPPYATVVMELRRCRVFTNLWVWLLIY